MRIEADGFAFDFTDALDAFIFDEKDRSKPTFHGQPMKAVDVVAEFEDAYVYVMERWNANFPKWPISRISTGAA